MVGDQTPGEAAHSHSDERLSESGSGITSQDARSPSTSPSTSEYSSSSTSTGETSGRDDHSASKEDEDEDDEPITITTRPKPGIHRVPTSDLSSRLQAANEDLEKDIAAGKLISAEIHDGSEDAREEADEGQYIEMHLGLGVLEEKQDDGSDTSSSGESSDSSDEDMSDERSGQLNNEQSGKETETYVLDKLMGNKSKMKKPTIEEVET